MVHSEMTIHLLHPSNIEAKALSKLLTEKNYTVIHHSRESIKTVISPSPPYVKQRLLIDTRCLFFLKTKHVEKLCKSNHSITLLGRLNHLFWFFQFGCTHINFVHPQDQVEYLLGAIQEIGKEQSLVSDRIMTFLNQEQKTQQTNILENDLEAHLTKTELQTMLEISKGKKTKQIAKSWSRSHHTVNNHRKNILKKIRSTGTFTLNKFCIEQRKEIQTLLAINENSNLINSIRKND
ncbi:helix-turn-helix transcriptional regulator [Fodinibius saliphilus]|uniref:helix-turn-helix transcriptional regulator n=1 Tax=Fodinibius saliphilus TaxID=1920650 RepID=UPI0014870240|nr:LuxR C-terminal-related transcriptional regulator [Fodinibius saliphilus]